MFLPVLSLLALLLGQTHGAKVYKKSGQVVDVVEEAGGTAYSPNSISTGSTRVSVASDSAAPPPLPDLTRKRWFAVLEPDITIPDEMCEQIKCLDTFTSSIHALHIEVRTQNLV